ncbi:MAG: glycine-rich domain-containing protein [Candidatus Sumerlaeaceae bacterium]
MNQSVGTLIVATTILCASAADAAGFKHGVEEFKTPGVSTFVAPRGVKAVMVEVWGAGGGGGAGFPTESLTGASGGGGGGGGYVRGWIPVKQKQSYTVTVGTGGTAGTPGGTPTGGAGTSSEIRDAANNILASAPGGGGAGPASAGQGGSGGTGPVVTAPNFLTRNGKSGSGGTVDGSFGFPGQPIQGSVEILESTGPNLQSGGGGTGGTSSVGQSDGRPGGRGHVIISW